jgi:voltage-gated potassium channel
MGTVGYVLLEQFSFLDAVYMTIITISTVGFKEVRDLSSDGKIFTMGLIVVGTGTMFYALGSAAQYIIEGQLGGILGRRRMKEEIARLKDHIIICGYGKVGREVARVFDAEDVKFVIIESNHEAFESATEDGFLSIHGDATNDDVLKQSGLQNARALVTALATDADNLYVTLSAKGLRSDIFVVARVYSEESEHKLRRAGADRTMSPYRIGGRRLAMLTLHPTVVDFLDTTSSRAGQFAFEDVEIRPDSSVAGQTFGEWLKQCGGAQILAVKKKDGQLLTNPPPETRIEVGDELVVVGTPEQLRSIDPLLE